MNIEARPIPVYSKFHDIQKEPDSIDSSIYHLLSLYSNENVLKKHRTVKKQKSFRPISFQQTNRSWLGEMKKPTTTYHTSKKRVTFSKTVTIIPTESKQIHSATLFEGDIYVDALEHLD